MESLKQLFKNKKVCILGYGLEGRSTLAWIKKYIMAELRSITIADENPSALHDELVNSCECKLRYGYDYLEGLSQYDLIIKSPGVNLTKLEEVFDEDRIISQSDIFLYAFKKQTIGITGTKGKSTTSSLLYEILKQDGREVLLLGNIGIPPLDAWEQVKEDTIIVFEMSSHQLEYIHHAPSIAVLLNLFQEHLDHYRDFFHYQMSKFNIVYRQHRDDLLVTHLDDQRIQQLIGEMNNQRQLRYFSLHPHTNNGMYLENNNLIFTEGQRTDIIASQNDLGHLKGEHNLLNAMAAILVALEKNVSLSTIIHSLKTFKGLIHRMEYVSEKQGITFYNDAIATIPEATMAAVESLELVGTLILGGFDRGIDYHDLAEFLIHSDIANLVFMGTAGERIMDEMKARDSSTQAKLYQAKDLADAVRFAFKHTPVNTICLLSPAASSYDQFKNFMEKGDTFKQLVYALK
ncbi:MAG: UDP-N-acetylmuramoyl-L-alanine--D-glutamate ligase [Bacteroidales bacterium]